MNNIIRIFISVAVLLATMANGLNASATGQSKVEIQNSALIASNSGKFNGQSTSGFTYHSGNLRVYLENAGINSYSYQLKNSNDYAIWEGTLAAGKSYTATFNPIDGDLAAGVYTLYLQNSDGSSSSCILAARDGLDE